MDTKACAANFKIVVSTWTAPMFLTPEKFTWAGSHKPTSTSTMEAPGPGATSRVKDISSTPEGSSAMEQALIAVMVVSGLAGTAACVAVVLAVRAVRRGYRAARARVRSLRAPQAPVTVGAMSSPAWWTAQNRRHRLWRAVSSAEHAVALARRSDVPIGDLPTLTTQLRSAALGVDAVLRANAHGGTLGAEDRAACEQVVAAATDIHQAALSSLRTTSHADTEPLLSAVQIEVAALAAGVRAATR